MTSVPLVYTMHHSEQIHGIKLLVLGAHWSRLRSCFLFESARSWYGLSRWHDKTGIRAEMFLAVVVLDQKEFE